MNYIYNKNAFDLMENLSDIPLQIHDIPYQVSVKNDEIDLKGRTPMIRNFGDWDVLPDLEKFANLCGKCASENGSGIVFFNNWNHISTLISELKKYFSVVYPIIWNKSNPRPQVRKRNFTMNYEMIVYFARGKYTFNFPNHAESFACYTHSVALGKCRLKDSNGKTAHNTQKPWKLIKHYIEILSNPGEVVLDAYAGVLTTGYAARSCGREFIVNDINKKYVDMGLNWIRKDFPDTGVIYDVTKNC